MATTYKIKDQIKNDTFNGVQYTYQDSVGDPIDLSTATIQIQFRFRSKTGTIVKDITSGSGITIDDGANGIFSIDPFIIDWTPDTYYYDIQHTIGTVVKTYTKGTLTVVQDVTDS